MSTPKSEKEEVMTTSWEGHKPAASQGSGLSANKVRWLKEKRERDVGSVY